MKRSIVVVVVIVAMGALLLFAMEDKQDSQVTVGKQVMADNKTAAKGKGDENDMEQRLRAESIRKYGDNIEWLVFSKEEFEEERRTLRKHYEQEFEKAEEITKRPVVLSIAKADINADGKQEMIWMIFHTFYRGASTAATLGISYYDENDRFVHIKLFPIAWTKMGLRPGEANWKELVIHDRLYRWDGERYAFVEEPVETLANDKYFKVTRDADKGYTVTVYGEEKKIVSKFRHIVEPRIVVVDEDILRASMLYGDKAEPSYEYYDRKKPRMSRMYHNVLAERSDRVVYATQDKKLIIRNIFDEKVYFKEVKMDFSPVKPPGKAFLKVEWDRPDRIVVQYLAGEERRMVTEEVILD